MTQFNPWADFLEDQPRAAYFSRSDQFGGPQRSQRQAGFFQNAFSTLYDQYLGTLGTQARAGMMPTGKWDDFMGGIDFNDFYHQQVPFRERTPGSNDFAPPTRWRLPGINA